MARQLPSCAGCADEWFPKQPGVCWGGGGLAGGSLIPWALRCSRKQLPENQSLGLTRAPGMPEGSPLFPSLPNPPVSKENSTINLKRMECRDENCRAQSSCSVNLHGGEALSVACRVLGRACLLCSLLWSPGCRLPAGKPWWEQRGPSYRATRPFSELSEEPRLMPSTSASARPGVGGVLPKPPHCSLKKL